MPRSARLSGWRPDELVRLKHVTGYAKLYESVPYSREYVASQTVEPSLIRWFQPPPSGCRPMRRSCFGRIAARWLYGGRGSSKSWSIATALVVQSHEKPLRVGVRARASGEHQGIGQTQYRDADQAPWAGRILQGDT